MGTNNDAPASPRPPFNAFKTVCHGLPLCIELFARSDGSCEIEWRNSHSIVERVFENKWSYKDKRGVRLVGFWSNSA